MFNGCKKRLNWLGSDWFIIIAIILFVVVLFLVLAPLVFQWAWNSFVVTEFHLTPVDYWLSLAAIILLGFLGSIFKK